MGGYKMPLTFNNTKTCEVFAKQTQEKGKGSHLFFEDNIIYSYGYHFPIACIMKKENIALFNSASYSVSTSKHKSYVLRALNYHKVLIVPCVVITDHNREEAHKENIEYLKEEIKANIQKLKRSRTYKIFHKENIKRLVNTFNDYIDDMAEEGFDIWLGGDVRTAIDGTYAVIGGSIQENYTVSLNPSINGYILKGSFNMTIRNLRTDLVLSKVLEFEKQTETSDLDYHGGSWFWP